MNWLISYIHGGNTLFLDTFYLKDKNPVTFLAQCTPNSLKYLFIWSKTTNHVCTYTVKKKTSESCLYMKYWVE